MSIALKGNEFEVESILAQLTRQLLFKTKKDMEKLFKKYFNF